ncbi:hypothetical protein M3Y99_01389200 [Aphelenchoides fujianensis]|nr:hypothetical protein M3Y99_01389200 [Aphelenchoides fujianensis]
MTEMRLLAVLFVCAVLPLAAHSAIHATAGLPPVAANTTAPPSELAVDNAYWQGFQDGRKLGVAKGFADGLKQGSALQANLTGYANGMRQGIEWGNVTGYTTGFLEGFKLGKDFGKIAGERAANEATSMLIFVMVFTILVACCIGIYKCRHGFVLEHKGVPVFEFPKEAAKNRV